ncbi:MAG: 16S rRNA (uracil(1498)-N(3))-methyltransferase [Spirochaetaceae bacterium]|jgi:RsmE family RNA methyltransferase|nr:16S rRNA (uracil(1498)-N(3))-methyltransferase [Spirochaetaceae bacterium]
MNIILFEEHELGLPLPARDERAAHLRSVLGKKAGDGFDAGVLGGKRGRGVIQQVGPDGAVWYTLDLRCPPPRRTPVRMALGFARPIQLKRILRDLASLGAAAVDLMGTELGEKSYKDTALLSGGGARAALIQGAVQARDTCIPLVTVYPSVREWLKAAPWPPLAALAALDNERPQGAFSCYDAPAPPPGLGGAERMVLAIGAERGWSERERQELEAAGFARLSLGRRALRTETACVAALILAMEKTGELG